MKDYRCNECGDQIMQDAWVVWDVESQDYVLHSIHENRWCVKCQAEPDVKEIKMKNKTYTIWLRCLGEDDQMRIYPNGDGFGYDDTMSDDFAIFESLKHAKEYCEMTDEYILDSDGRIVYEGEYIIDQDKGGVVKYADVPKETLLRWENE